MARFEYSVTTGAGASATCVLQTDTYSCSQGEEYKTTPLIYFRQQAHTFYGWYMVSKCDNVSVWGAEAWGNRVAATITTILQNGQFWTYNNPMTGSLSGSNMAEDSGQSQAGYSSVVTTRQTVSQLPGGTLSYTDWRVDSMPLFEISTNIPIFENMTQVNDYLRNGTGIENAINYDPVYPEVTGDKWTSAKLNLLRRRLMRLAISEMDYTPYFNYTISDGKAWVTSVKKDRWYQDFGNLNIAIPNSLEGYPVVVVNEVWE